MMRIAFSVLGTPVPQGSKRFVGTRAGRGVTIATLIATLGLTAAAQASTVAQAKNEIRRLFGKDAPRAYCIVGRESSWQPRAVSRTNDHGLFQLNAPTWARFFGPQWRMVYDPVQNARMAYVIYKRAGGFSPWNGGRWSC